MSKILELYTDISKSKQRFIDEVFESEIYKSAVPQLTIIDLGAYEGEFSFYCYNFAKKIYAIEPDPRPYAILEKRIKKYDLDRIKCFPIALSDRKRERSFYASQYGGSFLLPDDDTDHSDSSKIKVQSMSLAEFMEENKIEHVDILKVDIEGGEIDVFKSEDFKKVANKISLIIGEHLESVKGILEGCGFKSSEVEGNNLLFRKA